MGTLRAHRWVNDACTRCGLRRRETWVVDDAGRSVTALVWTDASGDRCIRPFPPFKGVDPPERPLLTLDRAFPGLPVASEPKCDRSSRPARPR